MKENKKEKTSKEQKQSTPLDDQVLDQTSGASNGTENDVKAVASHQPYGTPGTEWCF